MQELHETETRIRSLGWEDPLEKKMTTHSIIFAWHIPWTKEPIVHGVIKVHGITKESNMT